MRFLPTITIERILETGPVTESHSIAWSAERLREWAKTDDPWVR
jgi:hypothetical protein